MGKHGINGSFVCGDCVIYRKSMNQVNMIKLQDDLHRMGVRGTENGMKINPAKSKAIRLTKASAKDTLIYYPIGKEIPHSSGCKYLGINLKIT
jgi:4-hydroxy-L-threonine phosphate dehydrogenase PdxA